LEINPSVTSQGFHALNHILARDWRICEGGGLPKFRRPWDGSAMNLRRLLNIAFAVSVTVGLMLAPLAASIAVARAQPAGMTDMPMSADMPCCPDEQKSNGCQDCPLIAMCVLQTALSGPPATATLPGRQAIRTPHLVRDDLLADGLDRPPPDQPPRNLA
jgi:hypothetical protein